MPDNRAAAAPVNFAPSQMRYRSPSGSAIRKACLGDAVLKPIETRVVFIAELLHRMKDLFF